MSLVWLRRIADFQFKNYINKPDIGVGPGEDEIIKTGVKYLKDIKKEGGKTSSSRALKGEAAEAWKRVREKRGLEQEQEPHAVPAWRGY